MPQVQVIQPIQQQPKRLRVAAYARVSSDSEDQLNSLAVQVDYQSWMQMQSSTKFCAEQNCNLITAQQGMTIRQQCKSSAPAKNSNPQIHFQNHSTAPSSAKSSYTSIHISTSNCETDRHYNKEEHHEQRKNHRNSSH